MFGVSIGNPFAAIGEWRRRRREARSLRPRRTNSFIMLGQDLWRRFTTPLLNFTYWTHLLIGVCFYGSIGIWAELMRHYLLGVEESYSSIILAMHATYPAIICATAMQILLNKDQQTYFRSFAQLVSTVFFSMAAVCVVAADRLEQHLSFRLGLLGLISSVIFWWIANALDEGLKDVDPDNSTGGRLPDPGQIAPPSAQSDTVPTAMGELTL